ncbi:30S ribosomal protein S21 [Winogradskyella jejuensis]|uniref:Small ribosomal subunit protein bS21 n=1 Tax=Winogradskyella jejuensis TaxID=1089305 RepID=A0A1M5K5Z5_9FLAO|nr:30S ribosomal protein S21 [Winogradskyella jejuensis]SHG48206.1 SSU ribosomal protein S21P [Winogradskyella jejuensis]
MLKIEVNSGENIERALKRYKNKFNRTGVRRELQARKQYTKPSIERRAQLQKAEYVQGLRDAEQA